VTTVEDWVLARCLRRRERKMMRLWRRKAGNLNRRGRRVGAEGRVSGRELLVLVEMYASRCAYCEVEIDFRVRHGGRVPPDGATFDHVRPLARGGAGDVSNLLPSCAGCNGQRARVADPPDPVRRTS
jgi:hypothetical protein